MKTITAITPQVKNAKRCNIFLDGEFFCGMELETVVKNRLKAGMQIDEDTLEKVQLESERSVALDRAMTFLSGSVKSEKQTRDYLKEKGFTPAVCDNVIEKLKEYGFLDDEYYAKRYVETYSDKKGAFLLKQELKRKGMDEETAENALSDLGDQTDAAIAVAEKYARGKKSDAQTLQKTYRYLISKGFSFDEADTAVKRLKGDEE